MGTKLMVEIQDYKYRDSDGLHKRRGIWHYKLKIDGRWREISAHLQFAKCWGRLADEYKPLRENSKGPGIALTLEEERRLFETASKNPQWDAAYLASLIAVNTTMRGCELRGLRLGDLDLFAKTVTVRRDSTKTDAGCREIPLNETALGQLFG